MRGLLYPYSATLCLTGIQITLHICDTFQTSLVLELVVLSCFGLKVQMMVITKALLLLYNIDPSTIHEAQNATVWCVFENPASKGIFLCTICLFFYHKYQPWLLPAPPPASLWPIGSTHSFLESSWPPLATAEGPVARVQRGGLKNSSRLR